MKPCHSGIDVYIFRPLFYYFDFPFFFINAKCSLNDSSNLHNKNHCELACFSSAFFFHETVLLLKHTRIYLFYFAMKLCLARILHYIHISNYSLPSYTNINSSFSMFLLCWLMIFFFAKFRSMASAIENEKFAWKCV